MVHWYLLTKPLIFYLEKVQMYAGVVQEYIFSLRPRNIAIFFKSRSIRDKRTETTSTVSVFFFKKKSKIPDRKTELNIIRMNTVINIYQNIKPLELNFSNP